MSSPSRFDVHHILNPWMRWDEPVDAGEARAQWDRLVDALTRAGGVVSTMAAGPSAAMTFTRDAALVVGHERAIVLRNHGQRGDVEPRHVSTWMRRHGFIAEGLPHGDRVDGGNVLCVPEGWLIGVPPGADPGAIARLGRRLRPSSVTCVPLAGPEFGHLDTVLADLAGRAWMVYPAGLADRTLAGAEWQELFAGRPVITVHHDEARRLACNVVSVGDTVIGGGLSLRLCRAIEGLGLHPFPVPLGEFRKAGGGAHCLTSDLSPPQLPAPQEDVP